MSSRRVRRPVRPRSANARSLASLVERLESRELLSTLPVAQPMYKLAPFAGSSPPSGSFTPAQIQQAYQFNQVSYNGSGETIAIVDAYNDPDIQSDLNTFDTEFSLPSTTISVVNETGGSSLPAADPTGGWEMEESLDVEWAHAMAPGANIVLVEASSADLSDLLTAVKYASQHANVVSMSWGGSEFSGETSYDSDFSAARRRLRGGLGRQRRPGRVAGGLAERPGRRRHVADAEQQRRLGQRDRLERQHRRPQRLRAATVVPGRRGDDRHHDAGHPRRRLRRLVDRYLRRVRLVSLRDRAIETLGWVAVYGTSAGAPQWSAILAIADQGRAAAGLSALNSSGAQQVMDILYQNPGDFHDITSGTSTGNPEYTAGPGYDYVTGLGTPMVNLIVGSLDGSTSTTPPDTMVVSAPSSATAGTSFTYTVTAENPPAETWTPASRGRSASPAPTARSRACQALTRSPRPTTAWPPSPSRSRPPARRRSPRRARRGRSPRRSWSAPPRRASS